MNVFVIGETDSIFLEEIIGLCEGAGHRVRVATIGVPIARDERLRFDELNDLYADADMVVEAFIRNPSEIETVISELDARLPPGTVILAATHAASATQLAACCIDEGRVVGFAALPPVRDAKVVELMPSLQTYPAAVEKAQAFWRSIGREPVTVTDSVGGVLPRIVCNLINEAAYALTEGVATAEDIDLAMQLGTNHPRGPLAWADLIGIPHVVTILEALGREFGSDLYRPAPLLRQYARAGRKFYE